MRKEEALDIPAVSILEAIMVVACLLKAGKSIYHESAVAISYRRANHHGNAD